MMDKQLWHDWDSHLNNSVHKTFNRGRRGDGQSQATVIYYLCFNLYNDRTSYCKYWLVLELSVKSGSQSFRFNCTNTRPPMKMVLG